MIQFTVVNIVLQQPTADLEESQKKTDYQLFFELSNIDHKILHKFVNTHANFDDVVDVLSHMVKDIEPFNNTFGGSTHFSEYLIDSVEMVCIFSDPSRCFLI